MATLSTPFSGDFSGNTDFGADKDNNTHKLTGSVSITGSLTLNGVAVGGGGGGSPGGADTEIQYNDDGAFGGDASLTWAALDSLLTTPKFSADIAGSSLQDEGIINGPKILDTGQNSTFTFQYNGAVQLSGGAPFVGASYLIFLSNSVGPAAVTYDPELFKFPGGIVPTNTQTLGALDILTGVSDGNFIYVDMTKDFK